MRYTSLILVMLGALTPLAAAAQENGYTVLTADSLSAARGSVSHFEYGRGHFGRCVALAGPWRYRAGDDSSWADPHYDDSAWRSARTWIDFHAQARNALPPGLPGIGWFRLHLRVDSSLARLPMGLAVYRGTAAEVYLDGELVHQTGRVGRTRAEEKPGWSYAPAPIALHEDTMHVLAVRYSNFHAEELLEAGENAGFFVVLGERPTMWESHARLTRNVSVHQMLLTGVLMALAFLHLMLFLFSPAARLHLYFALFAASAAGVVFGDLYIHFVASNEANLLRFRLLQVLALPYGVSLLSFAHTVTHEDIPRYVYGVAAVGVMVGISVWFQYARSYLLVFFVLANVDAVRIFLKGMLRRQTDAWIIGLGLLPMAGLFVLFALFFLELAAPFWNLYEVPLYGYAMLLLALSMSVYLARDFARTKRVLERTNVRLEDYSQILEEQVTLRTQDLQAEMRRTQEQARRLRALDEAKSRFFANISHEFRTPLTLILGPAESALDGRYGSLPEALAKPLRRIRRQGRRLLHLVEQLLDLSRLEHGRLTLHLSEQNLVACLRRWIRSFVPLAERRGVRLAFRADEDRLPVSLDPDQLEKAITNLLSNALKFTPPGGKVFVTGGRRELAETAWAEVAVRDTGPGIAPEDRERIFDRFERADGAAARQHEGAGIGLALAKELVELHEGTLQVESEPGFGSTFLIRLPLNGVGGRESPAGPAQAPGEPASEENAIEPGETAMGEAAVGRAPPLVETQGADRFPLPEEGETPRSRVLVVEDHAEMRAYLREQLTARYCVLEAESAAEGLAVAREASPDLVLSDVMMPGMDGVALLERLRSDEQLSQIPVVLLTARAAEEDCVGGLARGADDYVVKPFSTQELLARVERLLQTRRTLQERYQKKLRVEPAGIVVDSDEEVFLRRVLEVAEAHLSESGFGAERLAETVGLSRRHLTRKLKSLMGEPPSDLLRRLRLERAAQLLKGESGTVAEVAYAVGFRSASHFTRTSASTSGAPLPNIVKRGRGPFVQRQEAASPPAPVAQRTISGP